MKAFLLLLLLLFFLSISFLQASEVNLRGTLDKRFVGQNSYIVLILPEPVSITDYGDAITAKELQIAVMDEKQWEKAVSMVGKNVSLRGTLMPAETRCHYTPLLLLINPSHAF